MIRVFAFLVLAFPLTAGEGCVAVDASRVVASHLAAAVPALAAVPADTFFGYAPMPGLRRRLRGVELRRIALHAGVDPGPLDDLCVERPTRQVSEPELRAVLEKVLPPGATIELTDFCHMPMPTGRLVFSLRDLVRPAAPSPNSRLTWRGRVFYDERRSVPFWAAVRIAVQREGFYAARDLPQGKVIEAADLVRQTRRESIFAAEPVSDATLLIGRELRRAVPAGSPLESSLAAEPREVLAGDAVRVHVHSGAAKLDFDAQAASSGRRGESILVINLQNKKRFKAIVDGRGSAVLDLESSSHDSAASSTRARTATRSLTGAGGTSAQRKNGTEALDARSSDPRS